jgi:hypothetical protein
MAVKRRTSSSVWSTSGLIPTAPTSSPASVKADQGGGPRPNGRPLPSSVSQKVKPLARRPPAKKALSSAPLPSA